MIYDLRLRALVQSEEKREHLRTSRENSAVCLQHSQH
jgi:hypothetical protein